MRKSIKTVFKLPPEAASHDSHCGKMKGILFVALLTLTSETATAQQRIFYDSKGHVVGRASTDGQGSTTHRDADGSVVGRASTNSEGTTTFYDPSWRTIGKVTGGKR